MSGQDALYIKAELMELGFKPHTKGTRQMEMALMLVLQDESLLHDAKHGVYPQVAARSGGTPESVERNLRYAIENAWVSGDLATQQKRFGYTVDPERGKPTNRAFLAQMSEHIRRNMRIEFP